MQTHTISVYSFDELDADVQAYLLVQHLKQLSQPTPSDQLKTFYKEFLLGRGFALSGDIRWRLAQWRDGVAFYGIIDLELLAEHYADVRQTLAKADALARARPRVQTWSNCEDVPRFSFFARIDRVAPQEADCWDAMSVQVSVAQNDGPIDLLEPQKCDHYLYWDGRGDPPEAYGLSYVAHELEDVIQCHCQQLSRLLEMYSYEDLTPLDYEEVARQQLRDAGEVFLVDGSRFT